MSVFLSTQSNTISLIPDFNIKDNKSLLKSEHTTLSGKYINYNFGLYDNFSLNVKYLPFSDGLLINEWWEQQNVINLNLENNNYNVVIFSLTKPLQNLNKPYYDLWRGSLIFNGI